MNQMNEVRYKLLVLGKNVSEYEEISEAEVGARWLYEMKNRLTPKEADSAYVQYLAMQQKREVAEAVLLLMTGASSLDEARDFYLQLLTAYNLWGDLMEKERMGTIRQGVFEDVEIAEDMRILGIQRLRAEAVAKEVAAKINVNEPSVITLI
jgi:hypothetical protein